MPTDTDFLRNLTAGTFRVGIMGQGYVGLPLALAFSQRMTAIGFDIDEARIQELLGSRSGFGHIDDAQVARALRAHRYAPTNDADRLGTCDAVVVCVPTPLGPHREPDLSYVRSAATLLAPNLRRGVLVCLESTTYPGTTGGEFREILESISGLSAGEDFYLAYSPEREDPGNLEHTTASIPKVVGGLTPKCLERAMALYGRAVKTVIPVSSLEHAEMTKLYENIFRCVNIALVNELKTICDSLKLDIWEVIRAASSKPFGFMPFYPGPGLGGHCIPIDPFYLTWAARKEHVSTRFIDLAGEINSAMPAHVASRVANALNQHGKAVNGASILLVGIAYKPNVEDTRESPALDVERLLRQGGAHVESYDPRVYRYPENLTREDIEARDAIVILTDHDDVDYGAIAEHARLIIDTRDAMRRRDTQPRGMVVRA